MVQRNKARCQSIYQDFQDPTLEFVNKSNDTKVKRKAHLRNVY